MLTPETEEHLAELIRTAEEPLSIRGGGTRGFVAPGQALCTSKMRGISLYEPGALTLVAQAGTPVEEIEQTLASERQRLAFEPMDHRALLGTTGAPTIGGIVAANVSGPRRIQGGAARDHALGVRFVDGSGAVIKNGGRVMKNVTGYDLVKLMAGSFGTLGVLTEVSLKVLPVPETSGTLMLRGLSDAAGIAAMSKAMGSPFEVTGAAHCAKLMDDTPITALRVEGFEASVAYRLEQLKTLLAASGADLEIASSEMSDWFWQGVRDAQKFSDADGDIWRISCKPSDGARLAAVAAAEDHYYDWGGGLIWMRLKGGTDLRKRLGAFDGHATLVRGDQATRAALGVFHPEAPGVAKLTAGLRARFDPKGILNRGLTAPVAMETA